MRARMLRHCTRLNCSLLPVAGFIALVVIVFIAAHSAGARQTALAGGIAVAAVVVLLMAAGLLLRARRPAAQSRARQPRPAGLSPAFWATGRLPEERQPPAAPRPALMCAAGCGRTAETELAGSRLCQPCADWLADSAVQQPGSLPPAGLLPHRCGQCGERPSVVWRAGQRLCAECAGDHDAAEVGGADYAFTQPPVIPAGETLGLVDMSEFEKGAQP